MRKTKRVATPMVAMIVVFSALIGGCGGGGGGATTPAPPDPEAKYVIEGIASSLNGNVESRVAGATVKLHRGANQVATTTTEADGTFVFSDLSTGNYRVTISSELFTTPRVAEKSWNVPLFGGDYHIDAMMTPVFNISGIVQTTGLTVVRGANVTLAVTGSSPWEYYVVTTGNDGSFFFEDVLGGRDYTISISNPGDITMVPRLSIDTDGITITSLDRTMVGLTITGAVPPCWDDTKAVDCADTNPGGDVSPRCDYPGTAGAMCVWVEN